MNWDDLRYLLAVERTGSLAAAARSLKVDQTTVSRRLADLQKELGTRLLEKTGAGARLTPAGQRACAIGESMESAALTLEREVAGHDAELEGSVRITLPGPFFTIIAPALSELRTRHPRLRFEIIGTVAMANLIKREADIALRMTRESQSSLISTRLGQLRWGLYATERYLRKHGKVEESLRGHDVIGYDAAMSRSPGGVWLSERLEGANVVLQVDNVTTAIDAASTGMGIAAALHYLAVREPRVQLARPEPIAETEAFLVTLPELAEVPRFRVVIDHLTQYVRAHLSSLPELAG